MTLGDSVLPQPSLPLGIPPPRSSNTPKLGSYLGVAEGSADPVTVEEQAALGWIPVHSQQPWPSLRRACCQVVQAGELSITI